MEGNKESLASAGLSHVEALPPSHKKAPRRGAGDLGSGSANLIDDALSGFETQFVLDTVKDDLKASETRLDCR